MRLNTILALLLIALGVAAFAYEGVTYKTREKAIDLGSVQVTTEKTKTIPVPPVVGAIAIIGAVVLLVAKTKNSPL